MRYIKQSKNPYGRKYTTGQDRHKENTSYRKAGATTKTCRICGSHMNVKYFYKTSGKVCKKCHNIRTKNYYLARIEKPKTFLQKLKGLFS